MSQSAPPAQSSRPAPSRSRRVLRAPVVVLAVFAVIAAALVAAGPAGAASSGLVLSRVYGGGGNSGATYTNDYIEIFNRGSSPVPLGGLSLQYASATGTGNFGASTTAKTELPDVSVPAGGYFLVQEAAGSTPSGTFTADFIDPTPINMSGSAGKVALVTGTDSLGCNGPSGNACDGAATARIIDLLGFGNANYFEGSAAAPGLSNSTDARRKGNGCTDTDDNSADFEAVTPAPRNSMTAPSPCGADTDTAPSVSATSPADRATEVPLSSNVDVTFSEPVNADASAFDVTCSGTGAHAFATSGGPTTFTLDPTSDFGYGDHCTVTVRGSAVTDQDTNDPPDTMTSDYVFSFDTAATNPCTSTDVTTVPEIQGSGDTTPYLGQDVTTRGVVSANFPGLSGFSLQDTAGDGNPSTSDGVFVFVPSGDFASAARALKPGDKVTLTAEAKEFQGQTELDFVSALTTCGMALPPAPTPFELPETTDGDLEHVEGMLVTIPTTLTVEQNYFLGRYGQLTLGAGGRRYQPTNQYRPGSAEAAALTDANRRSLIVLDDATTRQNPSPIPYLTGDLRRAGDTLTNGLTGMIDFGPINSNTSIRDYRVQPSTPVTFANTNPRTAAPEPVGGNLEVASFNVLNYFTTFGSRGANNQTEFDRQRTKIINAMAAIDADVFGLMEIENNDAALADLVAGLNAKYGSSTYAAVSDTGLNVGTDQIKVAMIYKPARVTPDGPAMTYPDPSFLGLGRVPLAQTFTLSSSRKTFSVVVNHFKSKGCPDPGEDPANQDQGDGQGCYNTQRVLEAQALLRFVDDVAKSAEDKNVLVIGDLNSYAMEDPIVTLQQGGLINEIARFVGPNAYSYVFDGLSGYLDHGLATAKMDKSVVGATEWHINADEPSVIDYNTEFKPDDRYSPSAYRSSDHDPVVIGIQLGKDK